MAFILVETETNGQVAKVIERTRTYVDGHFPELRGKPKAMWFGPTEAGVVEIRISGPDEEVLRAKAEHLLQAFRAVPGTIEIEQDWENKVLKVEVVVDQTRARRAGVTSQDIASSLNAFVSGGAITDYREGDAVIPIVLRGAQEERNQLANLFELSVYSGATGASVPLSQIAEIRSVWEPYRVNRRNLERTVTVSAKHLHLKAGQLVDEVRPAIETLDLPPGYHWEMGGELESAATAKERLFANFPLAGFLIVVLLVWQFNSFRRAGIILLTIPMAFVGAVVGLLVTGAPFGFMSLLGLLSLAGIITNNGIIMIDSIETNRHAGASTYDCDRLCGALPLPADPDDDDHDDSGPAAADRLEGPAVLQHGDRHLVRRRSRDGADAGCRPGHLQPAVQPVGLGQGVTTPASAGRRGAAAGDRFRPRRKVHRHDGKLLVRLPSRQVARARSPLRFRVDI